MTRTETIRTAIGIWRNTRFIPEMDDLVFQQATAFRESVLDMLDALLDEIERLEEGMSDEWKGVP